MQRHSRDHDTGYRARDCNLLPFQLHQCAQEEGPIATERLIVGEVSFVECDEDWLLSIELTYAYETRDDESWKQSHFQY